MSKAEYTDRPLTDEEKVFAEQHHDMIYRYLRIHQLDVDPWYDILIIPYLQAVKKYHTYEHLHKLKFEQVFFRTLDSARSNYYRDMNRAKRRPKGTVCSYDELISPMFHDDENYTCLEIIGNLSNSFHDAVEDQIIDKIVLHELMEEFGIGRQRKVFELLAMGYRNCEIRTILQMKKYYLDMIMDDMREIVGRYLDEYYND